MIGGDALLWLALVFMGGGILAYDIFCHREERVIGLREAAVWSTGYVVIAILYGVLVYYVRGAEDAAKYYTGWTLEKVLSLDNVMVFGVIFSYFGIAPEHRHWILHWGILGAIVLRLIFAAVGVGMLKAFGAPMLIVFGLIVLWSAWKIWQELRKGDDDEPVDYESTWYIKGTKRLLGDRVTSETDGHALFINGAATPLFFCLIAIEISDVMFALDSIPAIIAVTEDLLLVYAAMVFAIMGLRSLYFLLDALLRVLHLLSYALVLVLFWIGVKMLLAASEQLTGYGTHVDPITSLIFVLTTLALGVVASFIWPEKGKADG